MPKEPHDSEAPEPPARTQAALAAKQARAQARRLAGLALEALAEVAVKGSSEASRVAAAKEILDRAYGRPGAAETPGAAGEAGASLKVEDARRKLSRQIERLIEAETNLAGTKPAEAGGADLFSAKDED